MCWTVRRIHRLYKIEEKIKGKTIWNSHSCMYSGGLIVVNYIISPIWVDYWLETTEKNSNGVHSALGVAGWIYISDHSVNVSVYL